MVCSGRTKKLCRTLVLKARGATEFSSWELVSHHWRSEQVTAVSPSAWVARVPST